MIPTIPSSFSNEMGPHCAGPFNERLREALAFEAPYVIDCLVENRVVDSHALAKDLFTELKKYFVLCAVSGDVHLTMHSTMVDAAWHTFILFTPEYTDYGFRYFGRFLHHAPNVEGTHAVDAQWRLPSGLDVYDNSHESRYRHRFKNFKFDQFRDQYETLFNEPLSVVWYDELYVTLESRMINDRAERLIARSYDGTVELFDDTFGMILSVNTLAGSALNFIAGHADFYVRELSGDLTAAEKVGLSQQLMKAGVLRIAP